MKEELRKEFFKKYNDKLEKLRQLRHKIALLEEDKRIQKYNALKKDLETATEDLRGHLGYFILTKKECEHQLLILLSDKENTFYRCLECGNIYFYNSRGVPEALNALEIFYPPFSYPCLTDVENYKIIKQKYETYLLEGLDIDEIISKLKEEYKSADKYKGRIKKKI